MTVVAQPNPSDLIFVFVLLRGHLITVDNFETTHLNNELYEIQNNRWDWEKRYLHVNYSQNVDTNVNVSMVTTNLLNGSVESFFFVVSFN